MINNQSYLGHPIWYYNVYKNRTIVSTNNTLWCGDARKQSCWLDWPTGTRLDFPRSSVTKTGTSQQFWIPAGARPHYSTTQALWSVLPPLNISYNLSEWMIGLFLTTINYHHSTLLHRQLLLLLISTPRKFHPPKCEIQAAVANQVQQHQFICAFFE